LHARESSTKIKESPRFGFQKIAYLILRSRNWVALHNMKDYTFFFELINSDLNTPNISPAFFLNSMNNTISFPQDLLQKHSSETRATIFGIESLPDDYFQSERLKIIVSRSVAFCASQLHLYKNVFRNLLLNKEITFSEKNIF
jgi:hypothetical protein